LWVKAGHPVLFSLRHPNQLNHLVLAQAGTVPQAIAFGDVLSVAVPYHALAQTNRMFTKIPGRIANLIGPLIALPG
jgi:8-hydroxy-5-deazaflavin:NADPH oxidoreductase